MYTAMKLYMTSVWIESLLMARNMQFTASGSSAVSTNSSAPSAASPRRSFFAAAYTVPAAISAMSTMCAQRESSLVMRAYSR